MRTAPSRRAPLRRKPAHMSDACSYINDARKTPSRIPPARHLPTQHTGPRSVGRISISQLKGKFIGTDPCAWYGSGEPIAISVRRWLSYLTAVPGVGMDVFCIIGECGVLRAWTLRREGCCKWCDYTASMLRTCTLFPRRSCHATTYFLYSFCHTGSRHHKSA